MGEDTRKVKVLVGELPPNPTPEQLAAHEEEVKFLKNQKPEPVWTESDSQRIDADERDRQLKEAAQRRLDAEEGRRVMAEETAAAAAEAVGTKKGMPVMEPEATTDRMDAPPEMPAATANDGVPSEPAHTGNTLKGVPLPTTPPTGVPVQVLQQPGTSYEGTPQQPAATEATPKLPVPAAVLEHPKVHVAEAPPPPPVKPTVIPPPMAVGSGGSRKPPDTTQKVTATDIVEEKPTVADEPPEDPPKPANSWKWAKISGMVVLFLLIIGGLVLYGLHLNAQDHKVKSNKEQLAATQKAAVSEVNKAKTEAVSQVNASKTTALDEVAKTKDLAVAAVEDASNLASGQLLDASTAAANRINGLKEKIEKIFDEKEKKLDAKVSECKCPQKQEGTTTKPPEGCPPCPPCPPAEVAKKPDPPTRTATPAPTRKWKPKPTCKEGDLCERVAALEKTVKRHGDRLNGHDSDITALRTEQARQKAAADKLRAEFDEVSAAVQSHLGQTRTPAAVPRY